MGNYDLPQVTELISSHCLTCTETVLMSVMKRSRFCFRFSSTAYCVFRFHGILIMFIINSERGEPLESYKCCYLNISLIFLLLELINTAKNCFGRKHFGLSCSWAWLKFVFLGYFFCVWLSNLKHSSCVDGGIGFCQLNLLCFIIVLTLCGEI